MGIARRSPPSCLFSRLGRPSSLSLSLHVMFSSPLIVTGFAPVCPSLSGSEYPKVGTALQTQSYKDQSEKKDPSCGGWPLLLQGHAGDSICGAPVFFCTAAFHPVGPEPVFMRGLVANWRHLPWAMRFLLARSSILLQSLRIAALPESVSGHIPV